MPKKTTTTAKRAAKSKPERVSAVSYARDLQRQVRAEKQIRKLSAELERQIRKSDHRLLELGGALMGRAAVLHRAESDADIARAKAIHERMPAPVE